MLIMRKLDADMLIILATLLILIVIAAKQII